MMKNSNVILLVLLVAVCCTAADGETVDVDREDVVTAANEAIPLIRFGGKYRYRLQKIQTAEVTASEEPVFKLNLIAGPTVCEKEKSTDEIQNCEFRDTKRVYKCRVIIRKELEGSYKLLNQGCTLVSPSEI